MADHWTVRIGPGLDGPNAIAEAIELVEPYGHVFIGPGTYEESLNITKPLALVGVGRPVIVSPAPIKVTAPVRLSGLHVSQLGRDDSGYDDYSSAVFLAEGSSGSHVDDCELQAEAMAGVLIAGARTEAFVTRCAFTGTSECGVHVRTGRSTTTVEDSTFEVQGVGIWLIGGQELLARRSSFSGATVGIGSNFGFRAEVSECRFHGCDTPVRANLERQEQPGRATYFDVRLTGNERNGGSMPDVTYKGHMKSRDDARIGGQTQATQERPDWIVTILVDTLLPTPHGDGIQMLPIAAGATGSVVESNVSTGGHTFTSVGQDGQLVDDSGAIGVVIDGTTFMLPNSMLIAGLARVEPS